MSLRESQGASNANNSITSSTFWVAQTWTTTEAYLITGVKLWLSRAGVYTGNITISIKATDGSNKPTGADLATMTFDGSGLTTATAGDGITRNFDDSYSLSSGVIYAFVIRQSGSSTLRYRRHSAAGYAGGAIHVSSDSGSSWGNALTQDAKFEIYGDDPPPGKATTPTPTDDQEDLLITGKDQLKLLQWTAPAGETPDYLVYFRASGGAWVLQETITDDSTSHTLSTTVLDAFSYYSIYEWRIDTRSAGGTTTGDTWTFITTPSSQFTSYTRRSDYDADKVWLPGTGWVDINTFEGTGGGRFKGRVVIVGHEVIYFGDL